MGTNSAPLLADIFVYSYQEEWIQFLLSTEKKQYGQYYKFNPI